MSSHLISWCFTPSSFNGKEKDYESGFHYYGARYYWSELLTGWLSVDPLMDKYPNVSPYNYCHFNPIVIIDPDGNDEWEINKKGEVVRHIENKEKDGFYMVDKDGNRIDGQFVEFDYGTVENAQSQYHDESNRLFDWYQVRGNENGKQLFELLARNTEVEWGHTQMGKSGNEGLNIITTSHEKSREGCFNFLYRNKYKYGYTIRRHSHSHPGNTPYPSGLENGKADIGFARTLTKDAERRRGLVLSFLIFLPRSGKYVLYTSKSQMSSFIKPTRLPEIKIRVPRKQ